jgi:hypothetical protein
MVEVPAAMVVASPEPSIVATPVFDEDQVTWAVMLCVLLSL